MRRIGLPLAVLAGCGNSLPPPGQCAAPAATGDATVVAVQLVHATVGFDDLRYAPDLGMVIAAPEGFGQVFLIDPDSLAVTAITAPRGIASADAKAGLIYAADRANDQIVIVDVATQAVTTFALDAGVDYVRTSPTTDEVWVTMPGAGQVEVLAIAGTSLTKVGSISVGDPEGLVFDGQGRAYTQSSGNLVAIDVAARSVVGDWSTGCGGSHGFPQTDPAFGLAVAGCADNGGAEVFTADGQSRGGIEAGGGRAILAYNPTLHHLYLRGDGASTLDVIGVCSDGGMSTLAQVTIPAFGHGATADDRGHAWVCDPASGGVVRVTDPFGATM